MLKWTAIVIALLFLGLCTVSYLYGRSFRHAGILEGKGLLKMAYKDYTERGFVTNYGSTGYQFWLSTNVVSIGDTQYQCLITLRNSKFYGQGTLTMDSNQVFIWLDSNHPPKIIGAGYRPPLFPPRF
jgi:hypothetical protein